MKKKIYTPVLVNAAEMAREHPDTFQRPSKAFLDSLRPGDLAKVSDNTERFWCIITERDGDVFTGEVNNFLVASDQPFEVGDLIRFGADNIYDADHAPHDKTKVTLSDTDRRKAAESKASWKAVMKFAKDKPLSDQEWQALSKLSLIDRTRLQFGPGNVRWARSEKERQDNERFYRSL
jgi:hypothetical protein